MTPPVSEAAGTDAARRLRRWKWITRLLQGALALAVAFAVWSVSFAGDDGPPPVLPDTGEQFSLDLTVIDTVESDLVYVVEQRARPAYRIFSFDPRTGGVQTVLTVPTDAIIYGIALSEDAETLALAYSPDYEIDGSGIATLDLTAEVPIDASGLVTVLEPTTDLYFTDLAWSEPASIMATQVDLRVDDEALSIVSVDTGSGSVDVVATDAVDPTPASDGTYFLDVDDEGARRTIGKIDADGERSSIEPASSNLDLDQLVVSDAGTISVAVVEADGGDLTIGSVAEAHGNHDVPSQWWNVAVHEADPTWLATDLEETIVYDTAPTSGGFVYATREGLSFADPNSGGDGKIDVIASRALRFVAA